MPERRQPGDVFVADVEPFGPQFGERRIHINSVPQNDGIDDQPERTELIFLAFAVALPQLVPLAVEDNAGQLVRAFPEISICFAATQLAVFQGASDERI